MLPRPYPHRPPAATASCMRSTPAHGERVRAHRGKHWPSRSCPVQCCQALMQQTRRRCTNPARSRPCYTVHATPRQPCLTSSTPHSLRSHPAATLRPLHQRHEASLRVDRHTLAARSYRRSYSHRKPPPSRRLQLIRAVLRALGHPAPRGHCEMRGAAPEHHHRAASTQHVIQGHRGRR